MSSTGHLTVTQQLLGLTDTPASKDAADAYAIAIRRTIVAVLGIYRHRIANALMAVAGRGSDPVAGRHLLTAVIVGFIPAASSGLLLDSTIKEHLFGLWPVITAWIVGGIVILRWPDAAGQRGRALEITVRDGLIIGLVQCWPCGPA